MDENGAPPKPNRRRTYLQLGFNLEEREAVDGAAEAAGLNTHAWARDVLRVAVGLPRLTPGSLGVRLRRD